MLKCRDCQFTAPAIGQALVHRAETGHQDYALMEGDVVVVDWLQIQVKRTAPE